MLLETTYPVPFLIDPPISELEPMLSLALNPSTNRRAGLPQRYAREGTNGTPFRLTR